jgi:hypothetical protein
MRCANLLLAALVVAVVSTLRLVQKVPIKRGEKHVEDIRCSFAGSFDDCRGDRR